MTTTNNLFSPEDFNNTTYTCTYMMDNISNMINPVLPNGSKLIKQMLHLPEFSWDEQLIHGDIKIEDCKIPFAPVAVDLKSTKEVCFRKGNLASAVTGSCAVPGIFQPVEYEDMILADGGLQNTIPADIPRYFGCDYVVAVDVNKSRTYGTESTKFLDVLTCSIRILMKSNAIRGYVNGDVVIGPETKRFKSTRTDGFEDMIEEGYKATIDAMPKILELFKKKPRKKIKELPKDIVFLT